MLAGILGLGVDGQKFIAIGASVAWRTASQK